MPARVSVLIPVFERRDLVAQAVASALGQDVEGLEVIAVDNCSQDGTWELLQAIEDPRFRCLRNESNVGLFGNFNRCAAEIRGEYALFLGSDDRLEPGFLAHALGLLDAEPSAVLLSSRGRLIDREGRSKGTIGRRFPPGRYAGHSVPAAWFWSSYHYGENPLNYPSGVVLRSSALRACLPFRADLGAPADIDLFLGVLRHGDLLVTDRVGCAVMAHEGQEGLKARNDVTHQQLALMDVFRADLDSAGAYERVRRQSAALAFAALARTALSEPGRLAEQYRRFGRGMDEMLLAAAKCIGLRALDMFGVRWTPYLETASLSVEPMWFLAEDPEAIAKAGLPDPVGTALRSLRDEGLAILRGNVPHDACDAVIRDFDDYCRRHPESAEYRDAHALHERLAGLHLESAAARRVVFDPNVMALVEAAFRAAPVAVGSLYFEKGSTQSVHRDTPAFFTNPLNHFFGVWTALEDVHEGAGPLIYYRGGHRVAPDAALFLDRRVSLENYFRRVEQACREAGLELLEFYPRKGDTLVWHPQLPHGGAPIADPRRSRRSLVAHYIPDGVPIHGADVFFTIKKVGTAPNYRMLRFGPHQAIDQERPRFFHNRNEGNFDGA
jgi:phytanoyl-CoA hydroxylase